MKTEMAHGREGMRTAAIEAQGLRKTYRTTGTAVEALRGVDLEVDQGEFVAVMGPSGSGKSTLLHLAGGLDIPDGGRIVLDGVDLRTLSRRELARVRRRHVGFVFQFFNLVPILTVVENVELPALLDGRREASFREHRDRVLELLGLGGLRDKLPGQLSGGEQQRVAMARALINEPALLLTDEPTGNLDRATGQDVMGQLRRLHAEGQTILLVTHDPAVASHAERVVFMRDGLLVDEARLTAPGETSAVLSRLVQLEG